MSENKSTRDGEKNEQILCLVLFHLICKSHWENDIWTKARGGEKSQSYGYLGEEH